MTTEQTMLEHGAEGWGAFARSRLVTGALLLAALAAVQLIAGCNSKPQLTVPQTLVAPYDVSKGDVLWAVVPLRNESGTTVVDPYQVSDKVVAAASQVRGVRCLPMNRTIAGMRAMELVELTSPEQAQKLATLLGADGIIVGSITSYDPYNPPKLGLALALYSRPGLLDSPGNGNGSIDTRKLSYQPTDYHYFPRSTFKDAPESVVSEFLDGKNHQVLMDVQSYANGRSDPASALAWRRYIASMDLFCEFGAWHSVNRLLEHEWLRMARVTAKVPDRQP